MKTLSRPMFNWGGPVKQGIMHGIREPKKHGGKMLLVGQHPKEFQDKSGREQHWLPLLTYGASALRAAPLVYRGLKAGRMWAPGNLGAWGRIKSMLGPSGRFRTTTSQVPQQGNILTEAQIKAGMIPKMESSKMGILQALKDPKRFGMAIRENPITAFGAATIPASAIDLGREHGADVGKGAWNLTKRAAAALVPGDQSHWYEEPIKHDTVPGVPGGGSGGRGGAMYYDKTKKVPKKLSEAERLAFANKQREERVQKYLEMMGYDRSKKTAIADALIDASKIVSDRGTLDKRNITAELINPIIQATSKRLDKPDQIREAVGLMATKAEIEKDLSAETDALAKTLKTEQIEGLRRQAKESTIAGDVRAYNTKHGKLPTGSNLAEIARLRGLDITSAFNTTEVKKWMKDNKKNEIDYLTQITTVSPLDPGAYVVNKRILIVDENNTVQPYQY